MLGFRDLFRVAFWRPVENRGSHRRLLTSIEGQPVDKTQSRLTLLWSEYAPPWTFKLAFLLVKCKHLQYSVTLCLSSKV